MELTAAQIRRVDVSSLSVIDLEEMAGLKPVVLFELFLQPSNPLDLKAKVKCTNKNLLRDYILPALIQSGEVELKTARYHITPKGVKVFSRELLGIDEKQFTAVLYAIKTSNQTIASLSKDLCKDVDIDQLTDAIDILSFAKLVQDKGKFLELTKRGEGALTSLTEILNAPIKDLEEPFLAGNTNGFDHSDHTLDQGEGSLVFNLPLEGTPTSSLTDLNNKKRAPLSPYLEAEVQKAFRNLFGGGNFVTSSNEETPPTKVSSVPERKKKPSKSITLAREEAEVLYSELPTDSLTQLDILAALNEASEPKTIDDLAEVVYALDGYKKNELTQSSQISILSAIKALEKEGLASTNKDDQTKFQISSEGKELLQEWKEEEQAWIQTTSGAKSLLSKSYWS